IRTPSGPASARRPRGDGSRAAGRTGRSGGREGHGAPPGGGRHGL
ncbi:MAG: hypothetical protein AVDCRST_MAG79-1074, partial [uncultured Thermoleophilia bacterium]